MVIIHSKMAEVVMVGRFLAYIIARGDQIAICYNEYEKKWFHDPEKATYYQNVNDAKNALEGMAKYRNTARIQELHVINDHLLSVNEVARDQIIKGHE
ncbi:hypothetical protein [Serratia fonticola]|uniref:Uncharacterized protein n=2 Tax=Serratia fonticola TaxID=47917 RepID=A0AAW3WP97_SERFO|nr:hypothetical protein [Serratia fonticola]MBC3212748.1 hypothetical protein [Serratia fonticola]NYA11246.1 hypothetical protein [Serratia fonticola]NYA31150.1 hypothetical protein [Serratia fonticola]